MSTDSKTQYPTDTRPTPAILAFLRSHGFTEYPLDPAIQPWWRRGLDTPVTWDNAPTQVVDRLTREREAEKAHVAHLLDAEKVKNAAMAAENAALRAADSSPGWLTWEKIATAGGMLLTGTLAVQGPLMEFAADLGPTAGKAVNLILAICTAAVAGRITYVQSKRRDKAVEAKKAIPAASEPKA